MFKPGSEEIRTAVEQANEKIDKAVLKVHKSYANFHGNEETYHEFGVAWICKAIEEVLATAEENFAQGEYYTSFALALVCVDSLTKLAPRAENNPEQFFETHQKCMQLLAKFPEGRQEFISRRSVHMVVSEFRWLEPPIRPDSAYYEETLRRIRKIHEEDGYNAEESLNDFHGCAGHFREKGFQAAAYVMHRERLKFEETLPVDFDILENICNDVQKNSIDSEYIYNAVIEDSKNCSDIDAFELFLSAANYYSRKRSENPRSLRRVDGDVRDIPQKRRRI
jgi:hypothetical protein